MSNVNRDLVALLIKRNPADYQKMLDNLFCKKMETAKKDDPKMKAGFKKYMIVCFGYC